MFPGGGRTRVTGIQVENNYVTLPGEIFEEMTESGIVIVCGDFMSNVFLIVFVASYYFENISNLLPEGAQE